MGTAAVIVAVCELLCGVAKAQDPNKERQKVERFVSAIIELPLGKLTPAPRSRCLGG